ncbi:MAG: hypothetical protein ACRERS_05360, partial [Methylococcales bacterium]
SAVDQSILGQAPRIESKAPASCRPFDAAASEAGIGTSNREPIESERLRYDANFLDRLSIQSS